MSEPDDKTIHLKVRALITEKLVADYMGGQRAVAYTRYTYFGILNPIDTRKRRPSHDLVKEVVSFHTQKLMRVSTE